MSFDMARLGKLNLDRWPPKYRVATDYELQLDIDSEQELGFFKMMYQRFAKDLAAQGLASFKPYIVKESRKPGHYHVTVPLEHPLTAFDRGFLQACFGSDRRRELRTWGRVKLGLPDPIVFTIHDLEKPK
ncbi:MAG: hypothetical protein J3T61_03210 [Candidatus Brocadiales bacterium]|nr:hypothetical protein [Candidatus Bathyanammoxibius sp.]